VPDHAAAAPLVSVIIPTHERLALLQIALASVLAQRDVELEVIVVDEACSDGTPEFLQAQAQRDPRVRFVRHDTPRKLPAARNAGLAVARGTWVAFLDDDDVWHPGKLAAQLAAAQAARADWACTGVAHTDAQLRPFHIERPQPGIAAALRGRNAVPGGGSAVLARRAVIEQAGGFDEQLSAGEDWECWLRLAEAAGDPAIVPEALVGYRTGAASMSHDTTRMLGGFAQVAAKHPAVAFDRGEAAADLANYLGLQLARGGHRRAAAKLLLGVRPRRRAFLVRAAWVLATGQPWIRPTWSRPAAVRAELNEARAWLRESERDAARRFGAAAAVRA
jgi:glycosyltransferase involved in cell wall biosynthesis